MVLALDIDGAFDRVWHEGLLKKLDSMGVAGKSLELLRDYLTGRQMNVLVNGFTSKMRVVRAGIPQGSVLGPLLWTVMSSDMLAMLPEADAYVDDVTLSKTYSPHQEEEAIRHMEGRLELRQKWGAMWQVGFAAHKSQFMIIWRPAIVRYLRFGHQVLKSTDEVDILGLIYDKCLNFHKHILQISKRGAGKIASLRRVSWMTSQNDMETLYKAQVRSALEFAPLAWGGACPTHLGLLDKVQ